MNTDKTKLEINGSGFCLMHRSRDGDGLRYTPSTGRVYQTDGVHATAASGPSLEVPPAHPNGSSSSILATATDQKKTSTTSLDMKILHSMPIGGLVGATSFDYNSTPTSNATRSTVSSNPSHLLLSSTDPQARFKLSLPLSASFSRQDPVDLSTISVAASPGDGQTTSFYNDRLWPTSPPFDNDAGQTSHSNLNSKPIQPNLNMEDEVVAALDAALLAHPSERSEIFSPVLHQLRRRLNT